MMVWFMQMPLFVMVYICLNWMINININNKRLKTSHKNETLLWHYCLDHINEKRIKKLQEFNLLGLLDCKAIETCESCLIGKMTKAPFKKKGIRAKDLLELIHSDVCGPMSISARDGYRYFITFIDDYVAMAIFILWRTKVKPLASSKNSKMK